MSQHVISLVVNGEALESAVPARRMLADFIRDDKSCLSLAIQALGCSITTVEGLSEGDTLHPVQEAFLSCGGLQCGYCTPGFMMTTVALLKETPRPTQQQVRKALNGHLCRCTGYSQIVESVLQASELTNGH